MVRAYKTWDDLRDLELHHDAGVLKEYLSENSNFRTYIREALKG